ncbi:MAG: SemiSWEET family transporter [bacterium]
MEIFKTLTTIAGMAMSLGYYPQAYSIWKNKSAENISIPMFVIFSFGTIIWTVYGILLNDLTIIISFAIGVVGSWLVLICALKYRKK